MKREDHICSDGADTHEATPKRPCCCNSESVNSSSVVFHKSKKLIRKCYLSLFVLCLFLSFLFPLIITSIDHSYITYFLFLTPLIIYDVVAVPIGYLATSWLSKSYPLEVSREGICVKEWLRPKCFYAWEEGSFFVLSQYRLPILPTRLEIFDHHDKSRIIVPTFYDCHSIAEALEEKGIPRKTKPRKWITWRWW